MFESYKYGYKFIYARQHSKAVTEPILTKLRLRQQPFVNTPIPNCIKIDELLTASPTDRLAWSSLKAFFFFASFKMPKSLTFDVEYIYGFV